MVVDCQQGHFGYGKIEKIKESGNFIEVFCKKKEKPMLELIYRTASTTPESMNAADNRFDISSYQCYCLVMEFPQSLRQTNTVGYDMMYNDGFNDARISIKSQKEIFQRGYKSKKTKLTAPKSIVVRNCMTASNKIKEMKDFTYLLAIEGRLDKNEGVVYSRFAAISIQNIQKYRVKSDNDQLKVRIPNNGWDFLSDMRCDPLFVGVEEQNKIYKDCKESMWDTLRSKFRGDQL